MKNYFVFLKKEFLEYTRTYRLLILLAVFAIFGITNALIAKMLPELLAQFIPDISSALQAPTAYDSWDQFFKNASQMGLIVIVLVFSGILTSEVSKGTLINILTKGLSRSAVILAKYTGMVLMWTASVLVCFGLTLVYTLYLFPGDETANLLFSVCCLWLFGVFLLSLLLLASALMKHGYGVLLITGAIFAALMMLNVVPAVQKFSPLMLISANMPLVRGLMEISELWSVVGITAAISAVFVTGSVLIFQKKQL